MQKFDEMYTVLPFGGSDVRAHYKRYGQWLARQAPETMQARRAEAEMIFRRVGITFAVYGDKDEGGVSACYDKCAENWPPLLAAADAKAEGEYGLTDRTDGSKQWTYDGKPLYLWVKDQKPGDMTGDGVNDVWHTAKAD